MFLLVPAYPGIPGQKAVKRLCVCVRACVRVTSNKSCLLEAVRHCSWGLGSADFDGL